MGVAAFGAGCYPSVHAFGSSGEVRTKFLAAVDGPTGILNFCGAMRFEKESLHSSLRIRSPFRTPGSHWDQGTLNVPLFTSERPKGFISGLGDEPKLIEILIKSYTSESGRSGSISSHAKNRA